MGFLKNLFRRKKPPIDDSVAANGQASAKPARLPDSKGKKSRKGEQERAFLQHQHKSEIGPAGRAPRADSTNAQIGYSSSSSTPTKTSRDGNTNRDKKAESAPAGSPGYAKPEHGRVLSPRNQLLGPPGVPGKGTYLANAAHLDENLDNPTTMGTSPRLSHHQLQQFNRLHSSSPPSAPPAAHKMYSMSTELPRGQVNAMDDMNRSDASSSSFNLSTDAEDSEYEHLRRRGVLPGAPTTNSSTLDTSQTSGVSSPTAYTTDDDRLFAALQTDDDITLSTNPSLKDTVTQPQGLLRPLATTPDDEPGRIQSYMSSKSNSIPTYAATRETEEELRAWTVAPSSLKDNQSAARKGTSPSQVFTFENPVGRNKNGMDTGSNVRNNVSSDRSTQISNQIPGPQEFRSPISQSSDNSGFSSDPNFAGFADFASFGSNAFSGTKRTPALENSSWLEEKKVSDGPTPANTRDFYEYNRNFAKASATSPSDGTNQYAHSSSGGHDSSLSELLAQAKNKQRRTNRGTRSSRASSSSVNSAPAITASYLRQHHGLGRYNTGNGPNQIDRDSRITSEGTSVSDIIQSLEATNQSRLKSDPLRSAYGHRSVGDSGAIGTARAVKERLREKRRKEREVNSNVQKSRSSEGSSSDNSENEASESWLFDEVTGALGPRGIAADLESLSGRSNRSKSSQGNKSHKSHRSRSKRNRQSGSRRHKSSGDSVDSRGSRTSRNSRYSHRSTKSFLSQMSEQSRSVANDLLRLEMQLAMVGSQENRDDVPVRASGGSVGGTSIGGASRASRSGRKSLTSHHRASGHTSASSVSHFTRRSKNTVLAPPGKLGIILANKADSKGTVVSGVRTSSVLAEKISPGDRIVAIDGEDVSRMTVSEITTIMSRKADYDRTLTVLTTPKHMDHQYLHHQGQSSNGGVAVVRSPSNNGAAAESFDDNFALYRR